jgi:hypothetical protein
LMPRRSRSLGIVICSFVVIFVMGAGTTGFAQVVPRRKWIIVPDWSHCEPPTKPPSLSYDPLDAPSRQQNRGVSCLAKLSESDLLNSAAIPLPDGFASLLAGLQNLSNRLINKYLSGVTGVCLRIFPAKQGRVAAQGRRAGCW